MLKSSVSIHVLLLSISCIVVYLLVRSYEVWGPNIYINYNSVLLSIVYTCINIGIILDSRKNKNILLLILSIWNLLFCITRIYTLHVTGFSNPFNRCGATVYHVNETLIILIISSLCLWIGLHSRYNKSPQYSRQIFVSDKKAKLALCIFWIAIIIDFLSSINLPLISNVAIIITGLFLRPMYIFYLLIVYFVCSRNKINSFCVKLFIFSILFYIIYRTLGGSRSGIYVVAKMILYICLVLGVVKIKVRTIMLGCALIPLVVFVFAYTTYMRRTGGTDRTLSEKIQVANTVLNSSHLLSGEEAAAMIYDRIGYFDYACEMVTQREGLSTVVNFVSEIRSIIDNALTPGFDLFDQARMSHVIDKYYIYHRPVKKSELSELDYQSDELTLFGELYLLFHAPINYFILLLIGILLRRCWVIQRYRVKEKDIIYKSILIYLFEIALSSYGIDWLILDIVSFVIIYKLYDTFVFGESVPINCQSM